MDLHRTFEVGAPHKIAITSTRAIPSPSLCVRPAFHRRPCYLPSPAIIRRTVAIIMYCQPPRCRSGLGHRIVLAAVVSFSPAQLVSGFAAALRSAPDSAVARRPAVTWGGFAGECDAPNGVMIIRKRRRGKSDRDMQEVLKKEGIEF